MTMAQISYTRIIDISIPLKAGTAVYPGNPPVELESFRSASGSSTNSVIRMSTHAGTHIDSPGHAFKEGLDIDDLSLNLFMGPCRVLDMTASIGSISVSDLKTKDIRRGERILLKTTNSDRGFETFYDDYVYLSGEAAEYLANTGILLCGIDAWSIKQKGSTDNTPHTALLSRTIPILEGLDLKHVTEGSYTLVAFPLKIQAKDGAPARAVLLG